MERVRQFHLHYGEEILGCARTGGDRFVDAARRGIAAWMASNPAPRPGLDVRAETGYAFVRSDDLWLAFDCGPPAPDFLPPHAHADALSFQLWRRGVPVVVDPGMPTYEGGPRRDWFRGTRAHATVAVDGRDEFDLWRAFRAGTFPDVELLDASGDGSSGTCALAFRGSTQRWPRQSASSRSRPNDRIIASSDEPAFAEFNRVTLSICVLVLVLAYAAAAGSAGQ